MIPKTRKEAFKVLGLSESASKEDIKKAYHKLSLKWHPDKWSDKSQEEQKTATEKFKEISVAYKISRGKITEEFISQQPNDDWINNLAEYFENRAKELRRERYGSHLSEKEVDLFEALDDKDLAKTKILLEKVKNINIQTKPLNMWPRESILHYIVKNSCGDSESDWIELLEEVLSKYSTNNSISAHNSSVELCSQLNAIDVNIFAEGTGTPLHIACDLGNLDVINILLKHGANLNAHTVLKYTPLYYAIKKSNDVTKVLLEHGAKVGASYVEEKLILGSITEYNQNIVETLLLYTSSEQKSRMLQCIALSDDAETDHNIEIAKLLLKAGADSEFCDTETMFTNAGASFWAMHKGKSELVKLFNEHKRNDNSHSVKKQDAQPPITDNKNHHSQQKQPLGGEWTKENNNNFQQKKQINQPPIVGNPKHNSQQKQPSGTSLGGWTIGSALLFGAVGATLVAIGIIPEIVAIGVIATAVLSGIVGAAVGGAVGYLTDITVNKCCNSEMKAA